MWNSLTERAGEKGAALTISGHDKSVGLESRGAMSYICSHWSNCLPGGGGRSRLTILNRCSCALQLKTWRCLCRDPGLSLLKWEFTEEPGTEAGMSYMAMGLSWKEQYELSVPRKSVCRGVGPTHGWRTLRLASGTGIRESEILAKQREQELSFTARLMDRRHLNLNQK